MTQSEVLTLQMLRQIDQKLETLLKKLTREIPGGNSPNHSLSACARQIAALTPTVRQTDAVELLHEDRLR